MSSTAFNPLSTNNLEELTAMMNAATGASPFNPAKFNTGPKHPISLTLGNSEHPIREHLPLSMRRIPKYDGYYYAAAHDESYVVTYCAIAGQEAMQVLEMNKTQFRELVEGGGWIFVGNPLVKAEGADKYLGNGILRTLRAMGRLA